MVSAFSWFVVGVIALGTVVGLVGLLGTSVLLGFRSLTDRRDRRSTPVAQEMAVTSR